jgi:hypothetical protein
MNLLYQIEKIYWHMVDTNEVDWELIYKLEDETDAKQVRNLIDYCTSNLPRNHKMPGNIYYTLCGIGNYIKEHNHITPKQFRFVMANLAGYWTELLLVHH